MIADDVRRSNTNKEFGFSILSEAHILSRRCDQSYRYVRLSLLPMLLHHLLVVQHTQHTSAVQAQMRLTIVR